jgi:hypothetical protein
VVLIQIVAAILLLLGSALIFRALLALDLADQARASAAPRLVERLRRERANDEAGLPRAA